jgi:signal transduction histidine kinase
LKLQYKITALIFVILLIVGISGAAVMLNFQKRAALSQFEKSALTLAEALHDSLTHDMLDANQAHILDAVERISAGSIINEVVIYSSAQKIYASGELDEIGQTRNDAELALALASGKTVSRTENRYGYPEVCIILPVLTKPECHACHDPNLQILGAIEVGLDRGPLDAQIWHQTLIMGLIAGVTFVTIGGALTFMFRSAVVHPLSKLTLSTRRIAQGDFNARADVKTKDEVGILASTFNEMADRVQQYANALEDSKSELEQRVDERTVQLKKMAISRGQLLGRLISAQEEERRRIARELHDEAGQALTMIMMDLARAIDTLPREAIEAREKLSKSRSLAAQTLADLRKMIYDLRPEALDQLGLVPALRSYAKSRLEAQNIETRLHSVGLNERLSPQIETTLFRVIQEAITNIIRHSNASKVSIEVVAKESEITATVIDNGKGFNVDAALQAPDSWGLRGVQERVAVVGGQLNIESGAGRGTIIRVRIPLGTV